MDLQGVGQRIPTIPVDNSVQDQSFQGASSMHLGMAFGKRAHQVS